MFISGVPKSIKTRGKIGAFVGNLVTSFFHFEANRANVQRSLRVFDNIYLIHEVILKSSFCVRAIYVFTLEAVFFLLFQPVWGPTFCQTRGF